MEKCFINLEEIYVKWIRLDWEIYPCLYIARYNYITGRKKKLANFDILTVAKNVQ